MYSFDISIMVSCIANLGGSVVIVNALLIDRDITTVVHIRSRTLLANFLSGADLSYS